MLNETYGCRSYIMELPFFEVEVFCRPGGVCFCVGVIGELVFLISFPIGALDPLPIKLNLQAQVVFPVNPPGACLPARQGRAGIVVAVPACQTPQW